MKDLHVIVLAAGNSTRLRSQTSKVLHPVGGVPMLEHVLQAVRPLHPQSIVLVVGHGGEQVRERFAEFPRLVFAEQKERLGTAHAVKVGLQKLPKSAGKILILNGDAPLITSATLRGLLKCRRELAFLTAKLENPHGYGRVLRDSAGQALRIVEEKNATSTQRKIAEVNAGAYAISAASLRKWLPKIQVDSLKREYYLTDLVEIAAGSVEACEIQDASEILGANTRGELAQLNATLRRRLVAQHLDSGVGMEAPEQVYLEAPVKIGADTFLEAGVRLTGKTKIGKGCYLEAGCVLHDAVLEDGVRLRAYSYLEDCRVRTGAVVGPFARLRPATVVGKNAHVGNFVELKKTRLGEGSKANHLSYLGDATIGDRVNIGAGTITCNYDGKHKYPTVIDDEVFIGSDTQLVAPVRVERGAYVAAGTTVTKRVPARSLAISRTAQKNILGYRLRKG